VAKSGIRHYGIYYILPFVSMVASRHLRRELIDRADPFGPSFPLYISGILSFLLILTGNSFLFLLSGIFLRVYSWRPCPDAESVLLLVRPVEPHRRRRHGHSEYIRQHRLGAGGPCSGEKLIEEDRRLSMRLTGAILCLILSRHLGFANMRDKV
jgi:hypothetical protein